MAVVDKIVKLSICKFSFMLLSSRDSVEGKEVETGIEKEINNDQELIKEKVKELDRNVRQQKIEESRFLSFFKLKDFRRT